MTSWLKRLFKVAPAPGISEAGIKALATLAIWRLEVGYSDAIWGVVGPLKLSDGGRVLCRVIESLHKKQNT